MVTTVDTVPTPATGDDLLAELGLRPVINLGGSISRLGGTALAPEVVAAMTAASQRFVPLVELQAAASAVIAEATGADAGCVASGAAACLFLAAAACLAGLDPAKMDRLPDTAEMPNEFVVHRAHRNPYDHSIRAAGGRFAEFGYLGAANPGTRRWQIDAAINERTVGVFYSAGGATAPGVLPLAVVAAIAHEHGLPVIVDAAEMLPPRANLRRFLEEGADLVTFSGGKAIGAPAGSGMLAGRRDLILSATAQQQDMYVREGSWPGPQGADTAQAIPDPPQQPVGRIVKVGREEVVGLIVALRRYLARDETRDLERWAGIARRFASALEGIGGADTEILQPHGSVPTVSVSFPDLDRSAAIARATNVIGRARAHDPRVWAGEDFLDDGRVALNVQHIRDDEIDVAITRLREALLAD